MYLDSGDSSALRTLAQPLDIPTVYPRLQLAAFFIERNIFIFIGYWMVLYSIHGED